MFIEFRERRRGREREREINMDQLPPVHAPGRGGTHNLGRRPDQELNPQPFGI